MKSIETQSVIGYKAFNNDMTCLNNFQYEVGKTYAMNPNDADKIKLCKQGFHFCTIPIDVLKYYNENSKFAIIKATGEIKHGNDKSVCSQITIEKLITLDELYELSNGKFVRIDGTVEYYKNGHFHREDGPAIENSKNKTWSWYLNGELHRTDGPACNHFDTKEWYQYGKLHHTDGPAIEFLNGCKHWYINGILHRLDGPAIEWLDGTKQWYINGIFQESSITFGYLTQ